VPDAGRPERDGVLPQSFRRIATSGPGQQAPLLGRLSGAVSIGLWVTVIICGRMIGLRPSDRCHAADVVSFRRLRRPH
jgi:hypothetical protein